MSRTVVIGLFILSVSVLASCNAQNNQRCKNLNKQGIDSMMAHGSRPQNRTSSLEAALRLFEAAIRCDSSLKTPRVNRIAVLSELGEYQRAIDAIDELVKRVPDSSTLILKPPLFERLNMYDSARNLYKSLSLYFVKLRNNDPENVDLIYWCVFTKFKVSGWESVRADIDYYIKKYPNNTHLITILQTMNP